MAKFRAMLNI